MKNFRSLFLKQINVRLPGLAVQAGALAIIQNNLDNSTGTITFDIASGISSSTSNFSVRNQGTNNTGRVAVVKTGAGTLDFSTYDTGRMNYTAGLTVNGGTLSYNATAALGNSTAGGTITLGGGTLNYTGSSSVTIANNATLTAGTTSTLNNAAGTVTVSGTIGGSGNLTKSGAGTLALSAANTYNGTTTINAGTLQIGNVNALQNTTLDTGTSGSQTVNFTVAGANTYNIGGLQGSDDLSIGNNTVSIGANNANTTYSGGISGTGNLVKNGSGTLTLNGTNTYSGGTTLNTGTIVIGNANAAGNGTITQANGASLLKFDTTGTITNAMSVYNVLASQSATLSGAITVNNATWDIETGDTLTISGVVSGNGGVTKIGNGTLILSGSNSYNGTTVINAGTLNAANANALGSNNTVQVNGGTLLVSAADAINGKNIVMGGSGVGLQFSGNYSGAIGTLTLSANSIIDLGPDSVRIMIQGLTLSSHTLSFYNWSGLTLWNGGTGAADQDKVFLFPTIAPEDLNKISFYSGNGGDSFLGTGFDLGLEPTGFTPAWGHQIIPVPEPETWATGLLLLFGGAVWLWRKRSSLTTQRNLEGDAPSAP